MTAEQPRLFEVVGHVDEVAWTIPIRYDRDQGRLSFLMTERVGNDDLSFPGGKVEKDEDIHRCALREFREETGITIKEDELVSAGEQPFTFVFHGKAIKAHTFFTLLNPSNVVVREPDKHKGWRWLSYTEVQSAVIEKRLPKEVLEGWWLDIALDVVAEDIYTNTQEGRRLTHSRTPAWYMKGCREIAQEAAIERIREGLLG